MRLVREIAKDFGQGIRFSPDALETAHKNDESYLISLFKDINLWAIHAKRTIINPGIEASASPSL